MTAQTNACPPPLATIGYQSATLAAERFRAAFGCRVADL
jgi:hypothetical protein